MKLLKFQRNNKININWLKIMMKYYQRFTQKLFCQQIRNKAMISKKNKNFKDDISTCQIFTCFDWESAQPLELRYFKSSKRSLKKCTSHQTLNIPKLPQKSVPQPRITQQTTLKPALDFRSARNPYQSNVNLNRINSFSVMRSLSKQCRLQNCVPQNKKESSKQMPKILITLDPPGPTMNHEGVKNRMREMNKNFKKVTFKVKFNNKTENDEEPENRKQNFGKQSLQNQLKHNDNQSVYQTNSTRATKAKLSQTPQQMNQQLKNESNRIRHRNHPFFASEVMESKFIIQQSLNNRNWKVQIQRKDNENFGEPAGVQTNKIEKNKPLAISYLSSESDQSVVYETHHNLGSGMIHTLF